MNNLSKRLSELNALGWKVTAIIPKGSNYKKGKHDFIVFHAFNFPYGNEMRDVTFRYVLEFIDNFLKEEQHKEEVERFNLDR